MNHGKFFNIPPIKALERERWSAEDEDDLRSLSYVLNDAEGDCLGRLKRLAFQRSGADINELEIIPDTPFSQNPVLCGVNCLGIYLTLQKESLFSAKTTRQGREVGKQTGPLELLEFVERNLSKDLAGIKFDYRASNDKCIKILRLLYAEFVGFFRETFDGYKKSEAESLIHVAEDILMLGATGLKYGGENVVRRFLQRAANILKYAIGKK
ncbi:hypothetical protein G7Y89_g4434 [Cudoniella acicularis]|uniref:Uncharacterized protein n=1 Tax=Cudoniella acicularis TaxID=354080 RepID=A0A8H4RQX5_9HELO|nr:hypothetical protein G7Y89_g4434 [Cudoniella acicularis]